MTEKRLSLGINVSILLILTIFGVLLSLPLRLLFNTNYDAQNPEGEENENSPERSSSEARDKEMLESLIDYRKLKLSRRHRYEDRIRSLFYCDYGKDYNIVENLAIENEKEEETEDSFNIVKEEVQKEEKKIGLKVERVMDNDDDDDDDDEEEPHESKEIIVAGHILVTMLLVSAIAALVEVLRIRFSKDKSKRLKGRISLTKE
ncbi:hypothetical protein KPH14_008804 [Odynerus spinipes]|uniref:Uncharacterized protein n=1 Tax=Odynerus spinipes TaxID=1348599 RepID=A0AAD9R8E1_9HYME|nr:hypothetical protein KPH14_008804 [Odynerus spinipes]